MSASASSIPDPPVITSRKGKEKGVSATEHDKDERHNHGDNSKTSGKYDEKQDEEREKHIESINDMISSYLNPEILRKLSSVVNIEIGIQSRDDWENTNLSCLEHLNIQGYQTSSDEDLTTLMKTALGSIFIQTSPQSVGSIMACAWLLRSPGDVDKYVFKPVEMTGTTRNMKELLSSTLALGSANNFNWQITDKRRFLTEGAYICAALLRLVTKEPDNIKNGWGSLKRSYYKFYHDEMTLSIEPEEGCLDAIRSMFQQAVIRNTTALFLLQVPELSGQNLRVCKMLFGIHMSYTGMHSYNLLLYCASQLGVRVQVLLQLLKDPSHTRALQLAAKLYAEYDFPSTPEQKAKAEQGSTWKYARIFDPMAFATLQTKNCSDLTALLAVIAKKVGAGNSGDPTKIRQIASILTKNYELFEDKAVKIIEDCRNARRVDADEISGVAKLAQRTLRIE